MIIPYIKAIKYTEPLIVAINPIISSDDVYNIVINYASKTSNEYDNAEMWFDATSSFMRAEINIETMLVELNELFCINLFPDEIKKCVRYFMFSVEDIASEYIKKHSFLKKFIISEREFPETDVNYALVILVYEIYLSTLFLISLEKKDITYKNIMNAITRQDVSSKYNWQIDKMTIDLDDIVMSHRKFISEQRLEA